MTPLRGLLSIAVALLAGAVSIAIDRGRAGSGGRPTVGVWTDVPDAWPAGLAALDAGDAAAAVDALRSAAIGLGDDAPLELAEARLAAALRAAALRDAETAIEQIAVHGMPGWRRDVVFGITEYTRGARARLEAQQPAPDPTALTRGIGHANAAAESLQRALLAGGGDRDAIRRNAERALVLLGELRRLDEERRQDRNQGEEPPPPPEELEALEQDPRREERGGRLSPDELQALWRRLAEAEQEKRDARRKAQRERSRRVEQDW